MAFPTTKPVDGPDWSQNASFSTIQFGESVINGPGEILLEQPMGYYSYALLTLSGDSDGNYYSLGVQHLGWGPDEHGTISPTLLYQTDVTHVWPMPTVLPMSAYCPIIRIVTVSANNYPHNAGGTLTLMSSVPYTAGYLGGVVVASMIGTAAAGGNLLVYPLGCAPGLHALQFQTEATDFHVNLVQWLDPNQSISFILADENTTDRTNIQWIAPANGWLIDITNNDATDQDFMIQVTRTPY